jgi:hypothetical protein
VFGLPVGREREFLREIGLDLRESFTIGGEESLERFLTKRDGTQVGADVLAEATRRYTEQLAASGQVPQMSPEQAREQQRLMSYHMAEAIVP